MGQFVQYKKNNVKHWHVCESMSTIEINRHSGAEFEHWLHGRTKDMQEFVESSYISGRYCRTIFYYFFEDQIDALVFQLRFR